MSPSFSYLASLSSTAMLLAAASAAAQTTTPPPTEAQTSETVAPRTMAPTSRREADARRHFDVALSYYDQARYEEAAREFEEAHRLSGRSELLLNVSLAYESALRLDDAIAALERFLHDAPASSGFRESAGDRVIRLRHLRDQSRERVRREAEALTRERGTASAPPSPGQDRTEGAGLSELQIAGIAALGVSAAAGGVALVTGVMASAKHSDLEDACDEDGGCPADRENDISSGETLSHVSTILTGVTLVTGIAGALLLLLGGESDDHEGARVTATISATDEAVGAAVRVRF